MARILAQKTEAAHLAALRAERDRRLAASDWTQLADNRARLGELAAAWDAYRAACRQVVTDAKAARATSFPPQPEA